jgi:hypothetical protein
MKSWRSRLAMAGTSILISGLLLLPRTGGAQEKKPEVPAKEGRAVLLFNGRDLTGWTGNKELWSVDNGEIVGKSPGINRNEFLVHERQVGNFRLSVEVKLVPNNANSGIQFRSAQLDDGAMKGYQADIGEGWWGKLYHEHGRAQLWDKPADQHVKKEEWNRYVIEAAGHHVRTYLNDKLCVDLEDPEGELTGLVGLQIHSGGAMEVRFRNLRFHELPAESDR